jgi:MFS family permease
VNVLGHHLQPLRHSAYRSLFLAAAGSSIGTLLAAVALAIDVKDRTDSGLWVAAVLIVEFLPAIVIGLLLGPLIDRLPRRGLMVAADIARFSVFAALPFAPNVVSVVALAAVAGVANAFFRPALYAGLPNLVDEEELPQANALLQAVENLSWAVGPVLGGLLTAAAGPDAAYWLNAGSFAVSALLIAEIPARLLQSGAALSRGHWQDVLDGLEIVRRSRAALTVTVAWSVAMVALAFVNVGEIFLAKDALHAGDFGYGLLYGSIGVGLLVGNVLGAAFEPRLRIALLYAGGLAAMGVAFGIAGSVRSIWLAATLCMLGGIGNGVAGVCNPLLVQRGVADALRGRAFTVVMSINYLVLGAAMASAGPLLDALGPRRVWELAGVVLGASAAAALALAWPLGRGGVAEKSVRARAAEVEKARAPVVAA